MKVRIENQNIRFKITEEELNQLLDGHGLHIRMSFFDRDFVVNINPNEQDEMMELKLIHDQNDGYLCLLVSPSYIQNLSDMGRSRKGLEHKTADLFVSLQVDVRADTRKVGAR